MKSLLAFWMGWSLGFVAFGISPVAQAAACLGFIGALLIWIGLDWSQGVDQ